MSASNEPLTYRSALNTAGAGVGQLAKGTSGLSLLALRSAVRFGETGVVRARAANARRASAQERRSKLLRPRVLIAAAAGVLAVAGGAVVFTWLRRRPAPEVASEPPSLQASTNGLAPSTNGSAPVSTTAESDRPS